MRDKKVGMGRDGMGRMGLVNPFLASLLPVFPYVCGTSRERMGMEEWEGRNGKGGMG